MDFWIINGYTLGMRIPIVDENDEIISYRDKKDRVAGDVCRVTGLWVAAQNGDVLLAQRAFDKEYNPGLWGPAVAGTVEEGETYESNIVKEAKEEIGLAGYQFKLGPKFRRSSSHDYFVQWFTVVVSRESQFKKNDREVADIKWFSRTELDKLVEEKPDIFLPGFENYKSTF